MQNRRTCGWIEDGMGRAFNAALVRTGRKHLDIDMAQTGVHLEI
jgi:hypothetical protein